MPDNITTTTDVAPAVEIFYNRVLLEASKENMVYRQHAQKATMPRNSGNTYKWHRYPMPAAATTPLVEGQDPAGRKVSQESLTAKIQWYGRHVIAVLKSSLNQLESLNTGVASCAW